MTDPQGNDKAEAASSGTANLYRRAVTGGFWAFALRVCQQILAAGRLLLLAYLFVPGDFGLVAIAAVTIATLTTFTQTGFGAALIQKKGDIAADLNSVWTAGLVRAGLLFLVLFLGAPYAAHFFDAKPAITADHIMSPQSLARRLVESEEPAVAYLRERLDEATREERARRGRGCGRTGRRAERRATEDASAPQTGRQCSDVFSLSSASASTKYRR